MDRADQTKFLAEAPESVRGVLRKAFAGEGSPRQAIKAKCLDCCHWDRDEVANCTVILCPLHAWRPFQKARNPSEFAPVERFSDGSPAG